MANILTLLVRKFYGIYYLKIISDTATASYGDLFDRPDRFNCAPDFFTKKKTPITVFAFVL